MWSLMKSRDNETARFCVAYIMYCSIDGVVHDLKGKTSRSARSQ